MLNIYAMQSQSRELRKIDEITPGAWLNLENPSDKELEEVAEKTGVGEDMLKAALDEEERARIETDDGNTLIIVDIPVIDDSAEWYVYSTLPLGIITAGDYFITVCLRETAVLGDFIKGRVRNFDANKRTRFIYQILYLNAIKFLHCLKQIDKTSMRVQQTLHRSMKNKELIQLLDLEKALVYFSTSLNSNQIVIDRLRAMSTIKHYEDDDEILDDVIVENKQAIEMATIYRDIMSGTMDAFASVISNNQNTVMKFLAAITIILTIPTIIASIWGMNVGVPFAGTVWGFWAVIGIIVAVTVPVLIIMIKKRMF
ncbi:magnesium transporter CorA family protein [Pumilibacter intestinalis]|uniref:magnesium transporter CorA family protein n=1 Tax=Pumilibacter intestinalis TaxID=2941511 RepID=UPI00203F05AC|nr:magnesium transporter CorA family protein [Pumilibacter intestinalis]